MGIPELTVVAYWALLAATVLWPVTRICSRMGFSQWLALLALVPVGNLVLLWFLAYARWPVDAGRGAP
jgi:predicted PurR-regulated permease PerM